VSRTTAQGGSDGRRGGGNPVGAAVGVQGFASATNYLRSAVGTLAPGAAAGFGVSVAARVLVVPSTTAYLLNCNTLVSGHVLEGSGVNIRWRVADGGGVYVSTPNIILAAGDVGEIVLFTFVHTGAGAFIRAYRAGAEVGAGTAIAGYTPATAASRVSLGSDSAGTSPALWGRTVGALYFTGVPTPADILAHYNACKAANTMENMGGAGVVNVNRWQAKDNLPNAATWVDDIGGMVLTKTGTLQSVIFNPTWE